MSTSAFKRPLAILTVLGGLLIAAAPVSAQQGEIATDTPSGFPADHSAFTAAQPKTLACELMAVAPAGAHGVGAGITYNGHAGLGASSIAVSKGSIELIVTNNNDPDTMGRCLLSGEGEVNHPKYVTTGHPPRHHPPADNYIGVEMAISDGFTRVATRANEAAERAGALTLHSEGDS